MSATPPSSSPPCGLHHLVFPANGAPPHGTAVIIHGHGDYAARYESAVLPFRERGIACFASDQPGHGESPGRRGAISGFDAIDAMIDDDLARANSLGTRAKPILIGHSAGGLLAMRELLRHPDTYRAAWISSPLVWPDRTRHPAVTSLLLILGRILPGIQIGTGVTESMCRHDSTDEEPKSGEGSLFHSSITLGWAGNLVAAARHVRHQFPSRHPDIPILVTQGAADPICPANLLREFLATIAHPTLRYEEFDDVLHEPFADERKDDVLNTVAHWLDEL